MSHSFYHFSRSFGYQRKSKQHIKQTEKYERHGGGQISLYTEMVRRHEKRQSIDGSMLEWPRLLAVQWHCRPLELPSSVSPLLHFKGNNNNSCTYHTGDLTEKHDARMTSEKLSCLCKDVALVHMTVGLSDCCAALFRVAGLFCASTIRNMLLERRWAR